MITDAEIAEIEASICAQKEHGPIPCMIWGYHNWTGRLIARMREAEAKLKELQK